jgi:hypothetical protein
MTKQKTFKRRVRARMEKTGESYTAARRKLITIEEPAPVLPDFEPPISDERLVAATGNGWAHWIGLLDDWGAEHRSHRDIAAWLREAEGVAGWYAQSITVGWERARGRRAPGQRSGGWSAGASKTVPVAVERLFAAWDDEHVRARWLPGAPLRRRTATAPIRARYDWGEDGSRVVVGFEALGPARSRVALEHEKLADGDAVAAMKAFWRERLTALHELLTA